MSKKKTKQKKTTPQTIKISCPKCGYEFAVEDVISKQIEERYRTELNKKITEIENEFKAKETKLTQNEADLKKLQSEMDTQVAEKLKVETERLSKERNIAINGLFLTLKCKAEEILGKTVEKYPLEKIELWDDYPQTHFNQDNTKLIISLNKGCIDNTEQLLFQLSQECVHFISQSLPLPPTVLEEGTTVYFAEQIILANKGNLTASEKNYQDAAIQVKSLMAIDPEILINIRKNKPHLCAVTSDDLITANPKIPKCLADELCSPFYK